MDLIPSRGGRFEVLVDGAAVYEKSRTKRHAQPGEVVRLIRERGTQGTQGAQGAQDAQGTQGTQ